MKLISRIPAVSALCLLLLSAGKEAFAGQPDKSIEVLNEVMKEVPGHRVEADYSFKLMQGRTAVICSGHIVIQESRFHIFGDGMDIYCNGDTVTYLDPERKEAYVENAVRLDRYVRNNLSSIRELKTGNVSVSPLSDNLSEFDVPELDGDWVVTDLR